MQRHWRVALALLHMQRYTWVKVLHLRDTVRTIGMSWGVQELIDDFESRRRRCHARIVNKDLKPLLQKINLTNDRRCVGY